MLCDTASKCEQIRIFWERKSSGFSDTILSQRDMACRSETEKDVGVVSSSRCSVTSYIQCDSASKSEQISVLGRTVLLVSVTGCVPCDRPARGADMDSWERRSLSFSVTSLVQCDMVSKVNRWRCWRQG